jgi:hypothetical protein
VSRKRNPFYRPQSPEELLNALFKIFPTYRQCYQSDDDYHPTFHSILIDFTNFFGAQQETFSEEQLRLFGELANHAVNQEDNLENAFSTCFLEHLRQLKAKSKLSPFLSKLAK